jgi:hypothetical protein
MTEDHGEGVVRRFWEQIFGEGYVDAMDEVFGDDYRLHDLVYWKIHRLEDVKRIVEDTHRAMPGIRVVVEDQRPSEDGEVFTRFTVRVPLPEDPETPGQSTSSGAEREYSGMSLSRVAGGKIEESRIVWEALRASEELEPVFSSVADWWRWPPWR